MKTAWMVTLMIAVAGPASAQVMVYETHAKDAQKQLQVLLERSPSTGVHVMVETEAITGAPYTGEAVTESVQVLADGNKIVRRTTARVYRDSAGRTRREMLGADGQVETVTISDPAKGISHMLHPATQTAHQTAVATKLVRSSGVGSGRGTGATAHVTVTTASDDAKAAAAHETHVMTAAEAKAAQAAHVHATAEAKATRELQTEVTVVQSGLTTVGPISWVSQASTAGLYHTEADQMFTTPTTEVLSEQNMEGVRATGKRSTTVIPAGTIGNEQAITVVTEEWFSPDLKLLVMTKHVDPRAGETTYRLTNIVRSEPDASLFERPAGYTIK